MEPYVPLKVAADHFTVSVKTLRRYIAHKRIPGYRLGGQVRVKISELEESLGRMGSAV